ncbi:MAG: glycosyltransferase [Clostridia bacterium]|nr:glycosyltransferase [Clostridia bacterium]
MKILFVTSSMGFGGAERVVSVISSELSRRGHEVGIYMTKPSKECVYPLDDKITLHSEQRLDSMMGMLKNLRRFVLKYDPDIVVPFMTYQCIYTCFALAFTKYPVVVCERNDPNKIDGKDASRLHYILRDIAISMAKGAVFQTDGAKAYFSASIQKKSCTILNPLNFDTLSDDLDGVREDRIVNVGRLNKQKNQAMLIRAFNEIKDEFPTFTLDIYGDGQTKEQLTELCKELELEGRVFLRGNVSPVGDYIKNAKIFAFTSDYEGMPNALAEAMALGLACVSTDCSPGGARMLIDNDKNGLLVPCGDVASFSEALRVVLSNDEYARALGENAQNIRQRLDLCNIADQWEAYFRTIVKN